MILRNIFLYLLVALCGIICSPAYSQLSTDGAEQISKIKQGLNVFPPEGPCREPVIGSNGDFVIFSGHFSNFDEFVDEKSSNSSNIFIYRNGVVQLFSANVGGEAPEKLNSASNLTYGSYSPAVSRVINGKYAVAFTSDAKDLIAQYRPPSSASPRQVYLKFSSGVTTLISRRNGIPNKGANGESDQPTISMIAETPAEYRVCYRSNAGDLLSESSNIFGYQELFCVDVVESQQDQPPVFKGTWRVLSRSFNSGDSIDEPALSADGSTLVFSSKSALFGSLPPPYRQIYSITLSPTSGNLSLITVDDSEEGAPAWGDSSSPSISRDGKIITFIHDGGSVGGAGSTLKGFNGNNKKIFVASRDRTDFTQINLNERNAASNGECAAGTIDIDGRFAVFVDTGTNLAPLFSFPVGVKQVYIRDLITHKIALASVTQGEQIHQQPGNQNSGISAVSSVDYFNRHIAVGRLDGAGSLVVVALNSLATNLMTVTSSTSQGPFVYKSVFKTKDDEDATPTPTPSPSPSPTDTPRPTASPTPTSFTTGEVDSGTPIPLTNNVKIPDPPEVQVTQSNSDGTFDILILLKRFTLAKSASGKALFIGQASGKQGKITYQIELTKDGSKKRIQRVLSRNMTTIRKLTPGRYTLRYKVVATKGNKRIQSRMSPAKTFTLG